MNQALALRELALKRNTLVDYYSGGDGTYTVVVIEAEVDEQILSYEI